MVRWGIDSAASCEASVTSMVGPGLDIGCHLRRAELADGTSEIPIPPATSIICSNYQNLLDTRYALLYIPGGSERPGLSSRARWDTGLAINSVCAFPRIVGGRAMSTG